MNTQQKFDLEEVNKNISNKWQLQSKSYMKKGKKLWDRNKFMI